MASVNKVILDEAVLLDLYVAKRMSICEVSAAMSAARSTVRARLRDLKVLRDRAESLRLASAAGKLGAQMRGKRRHFTAEWIANMSAAAIARGERTARGVSIKPNGYLEYTRGEHKGRAVHVVSMETHLKRRLKGDEVVHHIDHDKSNNHISNLQLMSRSEHASLHGKELATQRRRAANGQFE